MLTTRPTHHPTDERLLEYASGAAPEPVALLVATHLALCPLCRHEAEELESLGGALLEDLPPEPMAAESLQQVLARTERPEEPSEREPAARVDRADPMVPQPLRGYLDAPLSELPWRRVGPIGEMQLLPEFPGLTTRLLWIRAGTAVPSHTHEGSELTLVLKGSFADEKERYLRGDVEEADSHIDHRPIADRDEDCICLAITDAPIKLTGRFGRLLNPFVRI